MTGHGEHRAAQDGRTPVLAGPGGPDASSGADGAPVSPMAHPIALAANAIPFDHPRSHQGRHQAARKIAEALLSGEWLVETLAETSRCVWHIPGEGHPYADECYHRRHGEGHGACWDGPHRQAEAIRKAVQS